MHTRIAALFAVAALAACGGGTTAPAGVTANFSSLYSDYLSSCKQCHAPNAPGRTSDIETSLDFSTAATAYSTLSGSAAGLSGNQQACNGVHFLVAGHPEQSLLVASLDATTRAAFSSGSCNQDGVTDETVKAGGAPSDAFITALKQWITDGAQNN